MSTAIASPKARPTPRITAAATPLEAAGRLTRNTVSISVAPRARLAASYSGGTARRAVSATRMTEGSSITASTTMAAKRLAPSGRRNHLRTAGTSTSIPTSPYTTDGIPARTSTAGRSTAASLGGASLARNTAHSRPTGAPSKMAPAAPYREASRKGRIPNRPAAGSHTRPRRKSQNPMCPNPGRPAKIR